MILVTKYLYGESPKTNFLEYPGRIVIKLTRSSNIMPMFLICLLVCPLVLSIPSISETLSIICLGLVAAAVFTHTRTIIIDEKTETISFIRGVVGLKMTTTRSFSDLASIKIETVNETVRGSRLTKLIEKHILVLIFKDGKTNPVEKSSDLEYVDSLTEAIERLCNLTRD